MSILIILFLIWFGPGMLGAYIYWRYVDYRKGEVLTLADLLTGALFTCMGWISLLAVGITAITESDVEIWRK
jgi:hypothetical protein